MHWWHTSFCLDSPAGWRRIDALRKSVAPASVRIGNATSVSESRAAASTKSPGGGAALARSARTVGDAVLDKASGLARVNLGFPCTTSLSLVAIGPLTGGWTGVAIRPPRHACLDVDAMMADARWVRLWKRMPKEA